MVEGHGTATKAGDAAEVSGLVSVFEAANTEGREWCGRVIGRELSGTVGDWCRKSLIELGMRRPGEEIEMKVRLENASVRLCALSIWDKAAGKPMFGLEKVVQLGEKSGKALDRVYQVAQRLSALSDEDMKELVGNSDGTPSDDSSSG